MSVALRFASFLLFACCIPVSGNGIAQDYPNKPIRLVVPESAGTGHDLLARIIAPEMSKVLEQSIVVENRPGAGGMVGLEYVAKQAPADGYTMSSAFIPILASLQVTVKDLRFDPAKDLPPIIGFGEQRMVFGSAAKLPWKNFGELVANAKANPGKLNYGTAVALTQVLTEAILRANSLDVVRVNYGGGLQYLQGLAGGEVQMGFSAEAGMGSMGDRFRPLAITGEQRSARFPDIPTFSELGFPQIPSMTFTFHVRSGTPKAATDKLYDAASRALSQQSVKDGYAKARLEVAEISPAATAKRLADVSRLFLEIAKQAGIQPQ